MTRWLWSDASLAVVALGIGRPWAPARGRVPPHAFTAQIALAHTPGEHPAKGPPKRRSHGGVAPPPAPAVCRKDPGRNARGIPDRSSGSGLRPALHGPGHDQPAGPPWSEGGEADSAALRPTPIRSAAVRYQGRPTRTVVRPGGAGADDQADRLTRRRARALKPDARGRRHSGRRPRRTIPGRRSAPGGPRHSESIPTWGRRQ